MNPEVEKDLTEAAGVLVAAASTDAWDAARAEFTRLLVGEGRVGAAKAGRWLDELADRAARTPPGERAAVLDSERHYWFSRLADLAADDPAIVEELRPVVIRLKEQTPADNRRWVQHNIARDNSQLFATQDGNIIFHQDPPAK